MCSAVVLDFVKMFKNPAPSLILFCHFVCSTCLPTSMIRMECNVIDPAVVSSSAVQHRQRHTAHLKCSCWSLIDEVAKSPTSYFSKRSLIKSLVFWNRERIFPIVIHFDCLKRKQYSITNFREVKTIWC